MKKTMNVNIFIIFLNFTGAKTATHPGRDQGILKMKVRVGRSLATSCSALEKAGHICKSGQSTPPAFLYRGFCGLTSLLPLCCCHLGFFLGIFLLPGKKDFMTQSLCLPSNLGSPRSCRQLSLEATLTNVGKAQGDGES